MNNGNGEKKETNQRPDSAKGLTTVIEIILFQFVIFSTGWTRLIAAILMVVVIVLYKLGIFDFDW